MRQGWGRVRKMGRDERVAGRRWAFVDRRTGRGTAKAGMRQLGTFMMETVDDNRLWDNGGTIDVASTTEACLGRKIVELVERLCASEID